MRPLCGQIPFPGREGRLARVAKALASDATFTDIAEAEGISRTIAAGVSYAREGAASSARHGRGGAV
jgi:hypothetical protein